MTLYSVVAPHAPNYETLFQNHSLSCSGGKWSLAPPKKQNEFHQILIDLCQPGTFNDFPKDQLVFFAQRINSVFTDTQKLETKPNNEYRIGPAQEDLRHSIEFNSKTEGYSWLASSYPTLVIDPDKEQGYASAQTFFDQLRLDYMAQPPFSIDCSRVSQNLIEPWKTSKAVNHLFKEFLEKNPAENSQKTVLNFLMRTQQLKFEQNPILTQKLFETGSSNLIYNVNPNNGSPKIHEFQNEDRVPFFGKEPSGKGQNHLGLVLEDTRKNLRRT